MKLIKPVVEGSVSSFEVTPQASDEYNAEIQRKLSTYVWNSGCASWYRTGYTGKIFTQWPGTITQYWWRMRNPIWGHYKVVGGEKWLKRQRIGKLFRRAGVAGMVLGLFWVSRNKEDMAELLKRFSGAVSSATTETGSD